MATLIIQIDGRHGRSSAIHRSTGEIITVGRSFMNDVILPDPYVDPNQVEFKLVENRWMMTILDRTNPVFLNKMPMEEGSGELQSGDKLVIGRTHITVYMENHEVEGTRKLLLAKGIRPTSIKPGVTLVMFAIMCLIIGIAKTQELSEIFKWKLITPEIRTTAILLIFWAGAWALAGRLLKHEQHFFPQLFYTSLIYTILVCLAPIGNYLEFALNSGTLGLVFGWGLYLAFLTALLKFNLTLSTNLKNTTTSALMVSACILLAIYSVINYNKDDFIRVPVYSKVLKPPFTKISRDQTLDEFLNETDTLFIKLKEVIEDDAKKGSAEKRKEKD